MTFKFQALKPYLGAFNTHRFDAINLHRPTLREGAGQDVLMPVIRGLRSYTFRLDVNTLCGIRWTITMFQ